MKKIYLVLSLLACFLGQAQKSAPVIGDAGTLIDLLKKDYNTSNPDSRDEDINADRGKVIGILKSYLDNSQTNVLEAKALLSPISYKDELEVLNKCKDALSATSKQDLKMDGTNLITIQTNVQTVQKGLIDAKSKFYTKKYEYDSKELTDILACYAANNPYMAFIIEQFLIKYQYLNSKDVDVYSEKNSFSSISKGTSFLGGDMVFETIIDGLSRFLAKRIKEELTLHAIGKIKTYLENPTPENYCHELLALLPTTTNYLKQFDADQLLNFTDELKQYIEQDLNNLLTNAEKLKETPRLKNYIAKYPDLEFAFEGLKIIPQLSKVKSPVDYFELLENSRVLANWRIDDTQIVKYNIAQSLRMASMLAYSMTIIENGEVKFASVDFVSNYGNEPNFYFLYFGLLHQQNCKYFDIKFKTSNATSTKFDIGAMMTQIPTTTVVGANENFKFLKSNLISITQNAEKIYNQAMAIKKKNKNNEEIKYEEIYDFINSFVGFSEEIIATADFLIDIKYKFITDDPATADERAYVGLKDKTAPYFSVAKIANNVVMDLHQKKYANAIVRAIEIPLSFKYLTSDQKAGMENIKATIENQKDLIKIKTLFAVDVTQPQNAVANNVRAMKTEFEFLELKFTDSEEKEETKEIVSGIKSLNSAIRANPPSDALVVAQYKSLKDILTKRYVAVLNRFGINPNGFSAYLKNALSENAKNEKIVAYLNESVRKYAKEVFAHEILNETANADPLNDLTKFLAEFANQTATSNAKITDNKAIKLIHFFNDISASKDGKDVEKAIDAFALPVGSSSLKEKASTYVSLNAFPGILLGNEHSDLKEDKNAFAIGFTAPVGFYLQFNNNYKAGVWGVFIPVIDIAAPVRLRLDSNKDTENLPEFNFNDIFSPGFYLTYGFPRSPFAVNFGIQSGPKLRNVSEDGAPAKDINSYRFGAGLVIDIPLFILSSKYKD